MKHVGLRAQKTDSAADGEWVVQDAHAAPWAQETPPPGMRPGSPAPSDRSLWRSSGETPLVGMASAEAIDGRTLRFRLKKNLALKNEKDGGDKSGGEGAAEGGERGAQ